MRTVYPRAIYMFGRRVSIADSILDNSRYVSHRKCCTPDGTPILRADHSYIIIWGYWNGPDERLAAKDGDYQQGINALAACRQGLIAQEEYLALLHTKKKRVAEVGVEDLNLRGTPEMRICNFEFLRRI